MKKTFILCALVVAASGCAPTKAQKITTFSEQITTYSCHDLEVEKRFINQMIPKIEDASAKHKRSTDVFAFTMALGLENISENSSASGKAHYAQSVSMYQQKLALIQLQQTERCSQP